jgi:spore coat polysaccharide biosynthesis protein SpsF
MKIVAIIQARMGSSRLPGKALKDIHGRSMLARVVRRTCRSALIDCLVVATTEKKADDAIVNECGHLGVSCLRGSEDDVLDRYYQAARAFSAEVVVRITSDCPLIDPEIIDRIIKSFLENNADYASNTLESTFPRGLDVEVFTFKALEEAWQNATKKFEHVHVTPYFYLHPEQFKIFSVTIKDNFSNYRWTVDTQEDLDLIRTVYKKIDKDDDFSWKDALRLFDDEPNLADINQHIRQKYLEEC